MASPSKPEWSSKQIVPPSKLSCFSGFDADAKGPQTQRCPQPPSGEASPIQPGATNSPCFRSINAFEMDPTTAAAVVLLEGKREPASPQTPSARLIIDPVTSIKVVSAARETPQEEEGFEGNEKRLQIDLKPDGSVGPLKFSRRFWDDVLAMVSAKILDFKASDAMEGYILSESSLFVTANRITLITCGTTILLSCLQILVDGIAGLGREIEYLQYSRKDFRYPWQQPAEHVSIASEYSILHECAPSGAPFILGPLDKDHYFMYVMDRITRPSREEVDMQLNIVMYDLAQDVREALYSEVDSTSSPITAAIRKKTGLDQIFDACAVLQDQIWTPCGYSANAWTGEEYCTTHITPEKHCSYASFETNASYASYSPIIDKVLRVFRPQRCHIIMLMDEESPCGVRRRAGFDIGEGAHEGYSLTGRTMNEFGPGYLVIKTDLVATEEAEAVAQ